MFHVRPRASGTVGEARQGHADGFAVLETHRERLETQMLRGRIVGL